MKNAELAQMESIRLTPEEQSELGRRYYAAVDAGDSATAAECLDKFTRLIYPMIVDRAAKRWSRSSHFADVVSYVYVGMFDALIRLRSYDPDKGSFTTWAMFHIDQRLRKYNCDAYAIVRVPQGSYSRGTPAAVAAMNARAEPWPDHLEPASDAETDWAATYEAADKIRELAGRIPNPRHRRAVFRRFGLDGRDPETNVQIARSLRVTSRTVKDRVRRGTGWIREQFQEEAS